MASEDRTMSDKNDDDDDTKNNSDRSSHAGDGGGGDSPSRSTKRSMVEVGIVVDDGETKMNGTVLVKDPFSEVFNNGLIVENILFFLDSKEIASKRRVAKLWNPLGLKVMKSPLHGKKSFQTNAELRNAVVNYCHGQRNDKWIVRIQTTATRQFEVKCVYGFVIGKWDVRQVKNFNDIFGGLKEFNEPLEWDTSNATTMQVMFGFANRFNSSLGPKFCTSNVKDMSRMFQNCHAFDQPGVSTFDTSSVVSMEAMFLHAESFNQPLNMFKTSRVFNMMDMLRGAESFNQTLEGLDTSNLKYMMGMLLWTPLVEQIDDPGHTLTEVWGWNLSRLEGDACDIAPGYY